MADNVSSLLKKAKKDKGQDPHTVIDNQGPSKCTRAHSKKVGDASRVEEMKSIAENMHILAYQATDLLQNT